MVVPASGFTIDNGVVFKPMALQPRFGYRAMRFRARSEEGNDMPFVVPFVEDLQRIRVGENGRHALGVFIGHIVADRAVDIDKKIFHRFRQSRTKRFPLFVESSFKELAIGR